MTKDLIKMCFIGILIITSISISPPIFATNTTHPIDPDNYKLTYIGRYTKTTPVSDGMIAVMVGTLFDQNDKMINTVKWGFVNAETGKVVIPPKYNSFPEELIGFGDTTDIVRYFEGIARIKTGTGYIAVDKSGKEIAPFGKYSHISNFHNGIAWVWKDNIGWGIINKSGKEIVKPGTYKVSGDGIWNTFDEGIINVSKSDKKIGNPFNNYVVFGYIDVNGKTVIPFGKYALTDDFSEGLACVSIGRYGTKQYKRFFIDKTGKKVFDVKTDGNYSLGFKNGLCVFNYFDEKDQSEYYGVIDRTGKEVIKPQKKHSNMFYYNDDYILAQASYKGSESLYRAVVLDKYGKEILTTKVMDLPNSTDEFFRDPSNGLAAKLSGKRLGQKISNGIVPMYSGTLFWDVYNLSTGKSIIPDGYSASLLDNLNRNDYDTFYRGGIFPEGMVKIYSPGDEVGTYNSIGIIDKNGETVVPMDKYNNVGFFSEGRCEVQDKETLQWGFVDSHGKEVIKPQFDQVSCFRDGKAVVGIYSGENTDNDSTMPLFDWYVLSTASSQ